ncbi:hypothetical protein H9647_00130 [Paenibacillus sp. Sa2BVA9]|uniref:DUF5704 domain-containing protein n=2 Tax=Paenibacillus gallinarum TaxID=2762232 RepID=A0ABR8SSJ5_9BACL|nr:hypothetical protein [Paenibacillus gallinarum]
MKGLMRKKLTIILISVISILSSVFILPPGQAKAIGVERLFQSPDNPNIYYFVGMVYFEVWRNSAGDWTDGKKPGGSYNVDGFDYTFSFNSSRKVKTVKVSNFNFNWKYAEETFDASRKGELATNNRKYYEDATSTRYNFTNPVVWTGKGTNTAYVPIYVNNGLLEANIQPIDRKKEEEDDGKHFDSTVLGYRYFFPTLFEIELEPEEGKAIIKHYTTTGKSLDGVSGFKNREEKIDKDKAYNFPHTTGTADYPYIGYKKSTVASPSGGDILPGDPPKFTYDASFPIYYVNFYYEPKIDPPPSQPSDPSGGGACTYNINPPSQVASPVSSFMEPGAQGHILADNNSNGRQFDATLGIPTSENLYANTWAMNYLYQHTFGQQKGKVTYTCNVEATYVLKWKEKQPDKVDDKGNKTPQPDIDKTDTEVKSYPFSFTRDYSYWKVNNLEVYQINEATMSNYALPSGNITLRPKGYSPPSLNMEHAEDVEVHVIPKETGDIRFTPEVVDKGGYSKPSPPDDTSKIKALAEGQTKPPDVKNDTLQFSYGGSTTTVMDGSTVSQNGPTPSKIPNPSKIGSYKETGEQVLFQDRLLISRSLMNQAHTTSSGSIKYGLLPTNIGGSGDKTYPVSPINTVTVHTPVVNYSSVTDDQEHNQKTKPNASRAAFILDRPFKVRIPTSGQHVSYPGYGDRDYAKYVRSKEVYFPFDVYSGDQRTFYPKNTWISVPVTQLEMEFFLPVWVDEEDYTVLFRTIAENAPADLSHQRDANTNLAHHVATDSAEVEVIGRLYDFHITDIADYEWENVFRSSPGSYVPSGFSYWTGLKGIDGAARGNKLPYNLPVRPGSHPVQSYANVAVNTGYHFKFDVKTKGNMFSSTDGIRITPAFYYVAEDGTERQEVDLYYSKGNKHFIRIGSEQDEEKRFVVLNTRLRNVPLTEMADTAAYRYAKELSDDDRHQTSKGVYTAQYVTGAAKTPAWAGRYSWMLLSRDLRTFMGPKDKLPEGVDTYRASASIQHWYGEYSLPADVVAVKKGTSLEKYARAEMLDDQSDVLLKNGYIIVNFNMESIQNGDTVNPHLQYIHSPLMNQWRLEGYERGFVTPKGYSFSSLDGDVLYYNSDLSSRDDFSSEVPH